MRLGTLAPRCSFAVLVALAAACGGKDKSPAASSSVSPPPPTPTPTAAAPATPPPLGQCSLPIVTQPSSGCPRTSPTFLTEVDTAINQLVAQKPEVFNTADSVGSGGYYVKSVGAYYVGVLRNLEAMGLCAAFDGEEVQVKNTNDFNDQYHILLSSNHIRRGESSYRATCHPASFPTSAPGPLPPRGDCSLPSSREVACGRDDDDHYRGDVEAAIRRLQQEQPAIFDGDTVLNTDAYFSGVAVNLRSAGYCAFYDGEEIETKKTNEFSEHYDILTSGNKVRTGEGSYRSSCYPAAF